MKLVWSTFCGTIWAWKSYMCRKYRYECGRFAALRHRASGCEHWPRPRKPEALPRRPHVRTRLRFYFLALRILRKKRKLCKRAPENGNFRQKKNSYRRGLVTKQWIKPVAKFRKKNSSISWCIQNPCFVSSWYCKIDSRQNVKNSPSVRLSVCPSVRLSVGPFVRLSVCPSVRLSVCPFVRLSVCPSVRLSVWSVCGQR